MEDFGKERWPVAWVALAIVGSMSLLGYLSIRFLPSAPGAPSPSNPRGDVTRAAVHIDAPPDWVDDTGTVTAPVRREFILHRDIDARVGKSIVTYRGFDEHSNLKIDVVILDLDPHVTYSRVVEISRAKEGFRLGEESLELISARKLRLYVWYYP